MAADSYIDYGPPDQSIWKTNSTIRYIECYGTQNPYWQAISDGFYFGDATGTKYTFNQTIGVVDSGWSTLSGPAEQINFIKEYITRNMQNVTVDSGGFTTFSCNQYFKTLPSVFIRLGGYWLEMLPEDYSIKVGTDSCKLLITENEDFWAIGMTVMRGYYIVFDIEGDRMGFVPQQDSKKSTLVSDVVPANTTVTPLVQPLITDNNQPTSTSKLTSFLSLVCFILIVVIVYLVIKQSFPDPVVQEEEEDTTF
jgi:hypothetical protein